MRQRIFNLFVHHTCKSMWVLKNVCGLPQAVVLLLCILTDAKLAAQDHQPTEAKCKDARRSYELLHPVNAHDINPCIKCIPLKRLMPTAVWTLRHEHAPATFCAWLSVHPAPPSASWPPPRTPSAAGPPFTCTISVMYQRDERIPLEHSESTNGGLQRHPLLSMQGC